MEKPWKAIGPGPVLAIVVALIGAKFFAFISTYAVNVFYFDQWDTLAPFFQGDTGLLHLFTRQFSTHRLGLGLISLKYLYAATHWSARAESFLIGGCVFGAMLLAIALKRRLFGRLAYSDVAIPLIILTLMQYETVIGATNPAFGAIPLLLITVYCAFLTLPNPFLRYALVLAADFLLIYTGYGFFMGLLTPVVFVLDVLRSLRKIGDVRLPLAVAGAVLSVSLLASFFFHYTFTPNTDCFEFPHRNLAAYPWFMALMFSAFLGPRRPVVLVTVAGLVGLAIAAAAFGIQVWRAMTRGPTGSPPNQHSTDVVTAVLLGYSLLYAASAAVGRVCLGLPDAAQAPRYSTLLIPAFLGIYFFLLMFPPVAPARFAMATFLVVILPGGVAFPSSAGHKLRDGKVAWASCYLRAADIAQCTGSTGFSVYPWPDRNGMREKLEYLRAHRLSFFYSLE